MSDKKIHVNKWEKDILGSKKKKKIISGVISEKGVNLFEKQDQGNWAE